MHTIDQFKMSTNPHSPVAPPQRPQSELTTPSTQALLRRQAQAQAQPPPPPPPSTPSQSQTIDAVTLQAILQTFQKSLQQKKDYPQPEMPRVGNVNQYGAWTGLGAAQEGTIPRSKDCMRQMIMEPAKAYTQLTYIETECRKGLKDQSGPLLCMDDETDSKLIVIALQNLYEMMEMKGMEGVFIIVQADGSEINMMKKPGY